MDNKFNNMINEFLANSDAKDENELNEKLQEFIKKYNVGEIEYESTILDDADELLEKAEKAKSKTQAIKYAKEPYDMCSDCFDAVLFQVHLEDNPLKRWNLLNEGLDFEKNRLNNEGYFEKDNIGYFYGCLKQDHILEGYMLKLII